MTVTGSSLVAVALAVASLPSGVFDCAIEKVAAVAVDAGKANASMIEGLPADSLKFRLRLAGNKAILDWPNSPIQATGTQAILTTGPGAVMALYVSGGPSLFTEAACANMVSFVQQPDKSLKLLITPTAISRDTEKNVRSPFLVLMEGRCVAGEAKK